MTPTFLIPLLSAVGDLSLINALPEARVKIYKAMEAPDALAITESDLGGILCLEPSMEHEGGVAQRGHRPLRLPRLPPSKDRVGRSVLGARAASV